MVVKEVVPTARAARGRLRKFRIYISPHTIEGVQGGRWYCKLLARAVF